MIGRKLELSRCAIEHVMSAREIYTAALALQHEFGDKAIDVAVARADKHLCKGELRESERWIQIGETLEQIKASSSRMVH